MNWYGDRALPWVIDKTGGTREMMRLRGLVCAGLSGRVLEIGFGSGLNVPAYPEAVTEVLAVDPSLYGRKLGAERLAEATIPVSFVALHAERLPVDDDSIDCVLSTMTLCTIPDLDSALSEIRRVLKPGGEFHFFDHGLAEEPRVRARQRKLSPLWQKVAGGCHLDRQIADELERAGYQLNWERLQLKGPGILSAFYIGIATTR
jgi:ubiquinone/menaquinone biosynthesis C-methylase UbiE